MGLAEISHAKLSSAYSLGGVKWTDDHWIIDQCVFRTHCLRILKNVTLFCLGILVSCEVLLVLLLDNHLHVPSIVYISLLAIYRQVLLRR